ncbi:putative glutathione-specific gamma-glutamylcyclotransferase 2 [Cimex lectularius]|uniref:glutathione-specific gamma-glutamylcyclotransferase n=1 Tax=Cimex lectularius TaxID=79782 RepID=A0A8I6RDQ0_CIMLE|nr:putative glutathione-specific gamma-glutamylcyclotransferase 2 [Cimex lectularius]
MWLFGYGSLIWKADFPFKRKVVGYIKGYVRRFYQASTDHRGVPGKPGRVVTILPSKDPEAVIWGVAYEIHKEDVPKVVNHLDYREKSGYDKKMVMFYPGPSEELAGRPFELVIYVGDTGNEWYLGEAEIGEIAHQIAESEGPSGTNAEYLFNLAKATRNLAPGFNDSHLFQLENAVTQILNQRTNKV